MHPSFQPLESHRLCGQPRRSCVRMCSKDTSGPPRETGKVKPLVASSYFYRGIATEDARDTLTAISTGVLVPMSVAVPVPLSTHPISRDCRQVGRSVDYR